MNIRRCTSGNASGWRAEDSMLLPKMMPMPMPDPSVPRPTARPAPSLASAAVLISCVAASVCHFVSFQG